MRQTHDVTPFLDAFQSHHGALAEPDWLKESRENALLHFARLGYPMRKHEAWRLTNVDHLPGLPVLPARPDAATDAAARLPHFNAPSHRVVLLNGHYASHLSEIGTLPKGVFLAPMKEALRLRPEIVEDAIAPSDVCGAQPFASLNAAFFGDGFALALDPDVDLDVPVEIVHYSDAPQAASVHVRSVIWASSGSRATILETYLGSGAGWTTAVTAVNIGEGACVRHVKIQDEAPGATHLAVSRASIAASARYETFFLTLGARYSRQDVHATAVGEAASIIVNGAYLLKDEQEATFAPLVDHAAPGCQTSEHFKGLVQDRAHGVFLGKMIVRPGADQTDAHQLNQNLLLSSNARVDTKPELEIHADEVKCSHGATVGDLDENALYYLRARGIRDVDARHMLMEAFASDALEQAALGDALTGHLRRYLSAWFARTGSASCP